MSHRSVLKVRGIEGLAAFQLQALIECADSLAIDPDWLACVVSFETGGSFDPAQKNHWAEADAKRRGVAYSGAIGLIQFMPSTAKALGTTSDALAGMSFTEQLEYVRRYMKTYASRIQSLEDCYLAVFYPAAIGRADSYVMGRRGSLGFDGRVYDQNAGFDRDKDGNVTRGEVCATIRAVRAAAGEGRIGFAPPVETTADEPTRLIDLTDVARTADEEARNE